MFAECAIKADIVFVLDSSGSIEERNFHKMKSFVSSIIADMDLEGDKTRVGVLIFSNNAHLKFHLNKYRQVPLHEHMFVLTFTEELLCMILLRAFILLINLLTVLIN